MASKTQPTISIKLLIDQERNKCILVEAGNDFVDTLRSLLTLPLGNIARLVQKHQSSQPGCLNNLYNSVQNLGLNSFRTDACERMLLYPRSIHEDKLKNLKLPMDDVTEPTKLFACEDFWCREKPGSLSYYETARCTCGKLMNREEGVAEVERDAVEDESMFFITDELRVMKGLPGDLINLLHKLGINNFCEIEETVLEIGSQEMTNILSHSFVSKTTLTDAFLRKQGINLSSAPLVAPIIKETTANDGKTNVKIMLRKSDRKILCTEASEDFVDLLFSFLTIPLDSVLEHLEGVKGNIFNLFKDLNTLFSITKQKDSEKAVLPPFYSCPNVFPNICSQDPLKYKSAKTGGFLNLLDPKSPRPNTTNSCGYVKKNSAFLVTDDLVVISLSSVSIISLLKELGIPLDDVEQHVVSIGEVEALALLKACLCSSSAALSASLNVYVKQPKEEPL